MTERKIRYAAYYFFVEETKSVESPLFSYISTLFIFLVVLFIHCYIYASRNSTESESGRNINSTPCSVLVHVNDNRRTYTHGRFVSRADEKEFEANPNP